jgi:hypothetical protein
MMISNGAGLLLTRQARPFICRSHRRGDSSDLTSKKFPAKSRFAARRSRHVLRIGPNIL